MQLFLHGGCVHFYSLWKQPIVDQRVTDQLEQIFPEVLSHESEKSQERPTESVVAGVAVVWVSPCLHTDVTIRTDPGHIVVIVCAHVNITIIAIYYYLYHYVDIPSIRAVSTQQSISMTRIVVMVLCDRQTGVTAMFFREA